MACAEPHQRTSRFDDGWLFQRGDAPGAEQPAFDDAHWRKLDLPHDWSLEDLPAAELTAAGGAATGAVGPFHPGLTAGKHFTGHTVGGVGWYRKHFDLPADVRRVAIEFDGVYVNAQVWINGQWLGVHPHGYTSFEFDLTPHLNPDGKGNVLVVQVRNEGRNSRWYSGSGIYRHVWLTTTPQVHIPTGGVSITTPEVTPQQARVKIAVEVKNDESTLREATLRVGVLDGSGTRLVSSPTSHRIEAGQTRVAECFIDVPNPQLWAPDTPAMYTAEIGVVAEGQVVDQLAVPFGIRTIAFDAERGFLINGGEVELRGGCVHHDNGPLGAMAIDRAEQRRVELLKSNGFNAVRSSHNPPSQAFLDACDQLGLLVIDEAFDQWNKSKEGNEQDYHRDFNEWCERDIAAMVRRDRNHPSVIMWSVGNEIPEQFQPGDTGRRLRNEVLKHDATRPITQAISTDWGEVIRNWDRLSDPAFEHLDIAGYNYLGDKYESDHTRHPQRVMYGSESFPKDALRYWLLVEQHPYVVGDFVWSAFDYLGEAGLAHSLTSRQKDSFFMSWPWCVAWCGDLDLCGFKKPQSFYRDVVWRRSLLETFVHEPLPPGETEVLSWWAWPKESASWNWSGHEGAPLQVSVYSRCERVRLLLNGKPLGEQPVSEATQLAARFEVPYEPGELLTQGLVGDKVVAQTRLETTGPPVGIRLSADRSPIGADRNDLAYVTVEIIDAAGRRTPHTEATIRFTVSGVGELAAQGSGAPNAPASYRAPQRRTFQGRCLAILRPTGGAGEIVLRAEAEGLQSAQLSVRAD
jgi:beta-galactosidase